MLNDILKNKTKQVSY